MEGRSDLLLGIDVDLRQDEASAVLRRQGLEDRRERLAWTAPRCPQVQYDGHGLTLEDDVTLEGRCRDVEDDAGRSTVHSGHATLLGFTLTRERTEIDGAAQWK